MAERQVGGYLLQAGGRNPLAVPLHRELKRALIRDAGICVEEFAALL